MTCFIESQLSELKEFAAKEKLEIVNFLDGTILIFCPPDPSPPQAGEDRIPFELFLIYTALTVFTIAKTWRYGEN